MTNKQAFATALTTLAATFGRELTPLAIDGYWAALSDLGEDQFKAASLKALRESKFMPSPAEIRSLVGLDPKLSLKSDIAIAWERVRWARRVHSYTTGVDFGPLVNAVIRSMGGWLTFCDWNDDALEAFERKKFESAYEAFAAKDVLGDISRPLRGEFDGIETVAIPGLTGKQPQQQLSSGRGPMGLLAGGQP